MSQARSRPSSKEAGSFRMASGQQGSSITRGSGLIETLALTNEVPPKPQPLKTLISLPTVNSYKPFSDPVSFLPLLNCISRAASFKVLGNSPGKNSFPFSRTQTFNAHRAILLAAILPPYPDP